MGGRHGLRNGVRVITYFAPTNEASHIHEDNETGRNGYCGTDWGTVTDGNR